MRPGDRCSWAIINVAHGDIAHVDLWAEPAFTLDAAIIELMQLCAHSDLISLWWSRTCRILRPSNGVMQNFSVLRECGCRWAVSVPVLGVLGLAARLAAVRAPLVD